MSNNGTFALWAKFLGLFDGSLTAVFAGPESSGIFYLGQN
jgi:hypothetical protein